MTPYERRNLLITSIGAMFAFAVLVVYYFQLGAMQQALKDSQKALQLEKRAWVGPTEATAGEFVAGKIFRTAVRIRNNGGSPAIDVEVAYMLQNVPKGGLPNFPNIWERTAHEPRGKSVLQPTDGIMVAPSTENDGPLNTDTVDAILHGDYISYIFGEVAYTDIFGDRHWTKWCYFYAPIRQTFSLCPFYNEVDKQKE
ncbi:MAG: hypothetical protein A3F68_03100 [Acidobacteria bacterium RIFCSPLOWO2_12_FULL_54_10]|nr:MAG: hypothetical protein A3F68_03100 [Acidobacteria bacterium RIFCSPLOWO2_12_FULL_54_10]